jgi:hypothetical protein
VSADEQLSTALQHTLAKIQGRNSFQGSGRDAGFAAGPGRQDFSDYGAEELVGVPLERPRITWFDLSGNRIGQCFERALGEGTPTHWSVATLPAAAVWSQIGDSKKKRTSMDACVTQYEHARLCACLCEWLPAFGIVHLDILVLLIFKINMTGGAEGLSRGNSN